MKGLFIIGSLARLVAVDEKFKAIVALHHGVRFHGRDCEMNCPAQINAAHFGVLRRARTVPKSIEP